jgi:GT2 family glycosyltransferase
MIVPPTHTVPSSVSVIVPVRDGGSAFGETLASLTRLAPAPLEILVVEDGPQQGPCAYPDTVTVLRLATGRGPAAARNAGALVARGDILLFLDADVVVQEDAVARIQDVMADSGVDAVFGSYDRMPASPGFVSQFKNLSHRFVHQHAREDAHTFWSACGAIRRPVFEALGGFDERFGVPSVEDIELGMRLTRAGRTIRLVKSLEVTHLKAWTFRSLVHTDIVRRAIPWSRLLLAEPRLPDDLNLRWRARIAATLAGILALTLATALVVPRVWPAGALVALALVVIDWPLWRYFASERGWVFALRAMPLQWLYYLYSGGAFFWVLLREGRPQPASVAADVRVPCE